MTEQHSEASCLKVVTVGKDGKRRFDRRTKQRLVEACLESGASVAGLALRHGVNANLLRKWIKLHQQRLAEASTLPSPAEPAFVPVVRVSSEQALVEIERTLAISSSPKTTASAPADRTASSTLTVQMPNGITLKLECGSNDASLLSAMIETLGRCDVPARR
ncbi:IS66-like element accessory protein TnpA [Burkholderia sp. Bp8998]|uniref:IS66-like element accessory protein TnpA n=1 Tax=Burkholderia sp. Bp8998 TaxID=2184557 RepID=UPI000F5B5D26|nr:transposase [Burkholderia sp. Bp8998]RQS06479.1 transposase [Burkholderia sp. Bp8998]